MKRQQLVDAYDEWISRYKWDLFGSLTFRCPPSASKADRIFHRWISEMELQDGTEDLRWVRVAERGAYGDHLHYHVLIGGLRHGSKWPWLLRWLELAGDCSISYYRPYAGGIRYMLKEVRPGCDFEIDFDFS